MSTIVLFGVCPYNVTMMSTQKKAKAERDAYMARQIKAALAWAKKELVKCQKDGLSKDDVADHILAHVGRTWNIGCQRAVEKQFDLMFTQPEDEDETEELDEEDAEIEELTSFARRTKVARIPLSKVAW